MRKLKLYTLVISLLFITIISLQGCKDDTVTNPPVENVDTTGLTRLAYADAIGARANVKLYVEEPLHTGYNRIYAVLHDSVTGVLIQDAHVTPNPHNHTAGAPSEAAEGDAIGGKFQFAIIFTTPSELDNVLHWGITLGIHNHSAPGEPEGDASFSDLDIKSSPGKFQTMLVPDGSTLYFSYINPKTPVTGLNNFEFLVDKSFDNTTFAFDTSYHVTIKPVLLSSGVASTGNINPLPSGEFGHYYGKTNFTSAGVWRVNLYLTKGTFSDSTYFDTGF